MPSILQKGSLAVAAYPLGRVLDGREFSNDPRGAPGLAGMQPACQQAASTSSRPCPGPQLPPVPLPPVPSARGSCSILPLLVCSEIT